MTQIGNAYGSALFQLSSEEGIDGEILEQLGGVCLLLEQNPDFVRLMTTPTLKKAQRLDILAECFGGRVHEYLFNFMAILAESNTYDQLPACLEEYRRLYNVRHGIVEVTAFTAVELTPQLKSALAEKLCTAMGKKVLLDNRVDPSCIGGVRLEMAGKSIDGSIKSRLEAIRENLLKAKAQ